MNDKLKMLALSLLACLSCLTSCDKVEEGNRLVVVNRTDGGDQPVAPDDTDYFAEQPRRVLMEDYTGQVCNNCPNATDLIGQLQKYYGHDLIVPVAIHCGPLGIQNSTDPLGLATPLGDEYFKHWNIEVQPMGLINRSDGVLSTEWWEAKVSFELFEDDDKTIRRMAPVNIWVEPATEGQNTTVRVTVAARKAAKGKLQLWLTEDSILAPQRLPDGTDQPLYKHNHVLRDAVNGAWGDDVELGEQEKKVFTYECHLDSRWKPENVSVVAFVYDAAGVMQTISKRIKE